MDGLMMRRLIEAVLVAALLLAAPLAALAQDEAGDWAKAAQKDDVMAYDAYLLNHADGAHAAEALDRAAAKSAAGLDPAAKNCNPGFPLMAYYSCASKAGPKVPDEAVAAAISAALNCTFETAMKMLDKARAVDGLSAVRGRMLANPASPSASRAAFDVDFILLALQYGVLTDTVDELYKCKVGKDPFRDPTKKELYDCSKSQREMQVLMAKLMAEQFKSDFERISAVSDREYRLNFWERCRKEAKRDLVQEIAAAYKLYDEAQKAKARESDPKIAEKIDQVAIMLAGGGKPTGGGLR
jgi:hypothetical protein